MRLVTKFALGLALLCFLLPATAHAWGKTGHRVVGRIAENHLTPEAAAAVAELLAPEELAYVGTWSDWIRSDRAWDHASPWHYVSIEDDETYETTEKNPAGDILAKLQEFEDQLRDPDTPRQKKVEAVKWLNHLIGDLHQPLHVGRRADRGGNGIAVIWFDEPDNLHNVWDNSIIDHEDLSFSEWVEWLGTPTPEQVQAWQGTTYLDWANESFALRSQVYDLNGGRLSWQYVFKNRETLKERLLRAGVRLAGVLNSVFAEE
jgi:hypothetical protein